MENKAFYCDDTNRKVVMISVENYGQFDTDGNEWETIK